MAGTYDEKKDEKSSNDAKDEKTSKNKMKTVKVTVKGAKMLPNVDVAQMIGMPSSLGPKHKPLVTIEEIKNGYVIKACCGDGNDAVFVESLMKAPTILKKLFDIGNKSAPQIKEMVSSSID